MARYIPYRSTTPGRGTVMAASILITGASSGIGAALARAYAAPGVQLSLWGRNAERLAKIAEDCRGRGASVSAIAWDFRDIAGLASRIEALDSERAIELAIFCAGVGGAIPPGRIVETPEQTRDVAMVNFSAATIAATAMANRMVERRRGHIVLIGSLAESFPFPIAPTYAATKAGLRTFAEALGIAVDIRDVAVTLVSPGFVDTPMSGLLTGPKPLMITAEAAATIIRRGVERRARRVVFPWRLALLRRLFLCLPRPLRHAIMRRIKA
ncbi:MAG TPA: SDR family NAD(P)-dependent oxidoreductase [Stellaceae bacterium]|nr:SDR family NAD(P)-dependent oxidoreductase [Stellaceae bacterium]